MKQLRNNMINTYGKRGEEWIDSLPETLQALADYWQLSNFVPIENKTYHYVVKATKQSHQPVVLKIGCDKKSIANEMQALKYFNGNGSIQFLDYHSRYDALLLEQAIPGTTLTDFYPQNLEYVIDCYATTVKKLHEKSLSIHQPHISDWLKAIDDAKHTALLSNDLLKSAIRLKNELLTTMTMQKFLHGDLHHDNIIKQGENWVAIDPKGVVGEPEFEVAAFDFMHIKELKENKSVKSIFESRVDLLAKKTGLDSERIKNWVWIRLILMGVWQIEDNEDATYAFELAKALV